jgi:hypothetical protein
MASNVLTEWETAAGRAPVWSNHFNHRNATKQFRTASPCEFCSLCALIRFKSRIQDAGWKPMADPRAGPAGTDLRPTDVQVPAIEIDHRSARSRSRLLRSSLIDITGLRAGGPRPTDIGGAIHPCRKASNKSASDSIGLRAGPGGPISATTRSRSVTRTVSGCESDVFTELIFEREATCQNGQATCPLLDPAAPMLGA